jgi:peptide/nickel transport system substrate-binding protein
MKRWLLWPGLAALAATSAFGLAACGGSSSSSADTSGGSSGSNDVNAVIKELGGEATFGTPAKGGTFRIANTDFAQSDAFDPSGEYFGSAWTIYNSLMLRTLVSYSFHAGEAGNTLRADLAESIPEPTDGGTKYTFTIKPGIKFGPPVNREVTSQDVKYAIERIGTPSVAAQYPGYFRPIKGFAEFSEGKATTISGIATPDKSTISFTLTGPKGDFLYALAMPASAPIPQEVAKCHTQAGEYGRYIISSGPYMVKGADKLNISSCGAQKPISGFNPNTGLQLVRNPNYDPATDDPAVRENYPDAFDISVNTNLDDIFNRIEAGQLEGSFETPPNSVLRQYIQDPQNRDRLRINAADRIWFAFMNLTTPPFDDVHVRKAMNLVMDLDGIQRSWGGPVQGAIPTDVLPDTMAPELTNTNYNPYQSEPFTGDVEAAKAEMKQSKYDTNQDGICDAAACKGVINVNRNFAPWSTMAPIIEQSAAKIGVQITTRPASRSAVNNAVSTTAKKIPFSSGNGWGKDYADPSTYMVLFDSRSLIPVGNTAFSLVGVTQKQAKTLGVTIPAGGVPSVDADIDKCNPLSGQERQDCWIALDKKLMEQVVPWVPLMDATAIDLIGPAVTKYDFDQNGSEMGLSHVAVDPALQKN